MSAELKCVIIVCTVDYAGITSYLRMPSLARLCRCSLADKITVSACRGGGNVGDPRDLPLAGAGSVPRSHRAIGARSQPLARPLANAESAYR